MFSFNPRIHHPEIVLEKHVSVKAAAEFSGYSIQYLRRLLRIGRLDGIKIGQVWLIKIASLDAYLKQARSMRDRRCGPRAPSDTEADPFYEILSTNVDATCKHT